MLCVFLLNKRIFKPFLPILKIVLITILIVVLLNFPIFLDANVIYKRETNKVALDFKIYRLLRVFSGFIKPVENGIEIYYHKKMKKIFYTKMLGIRKTIKPFYDYHFIKVKTKIEIGNGNSLIMPLSKGFLLYYVNSFIRDFLKYKKPHLKIDNTINVYENENLFNVFFETKIILNLLMIVISLIKIISGKIINAKKISQQN